MRFAQTVARVSLALLVSSLAASAASWTVDSPNGLNHLSVQLTESGPGQGSLAYTVRHGPGTGTEVIQTSPLGIVLDQGNLAAGLKFEGAKGPTLIEEKYKLVHGKRRECHNRANELAISFVNGSGQRLELQLRAYDDGVAFRYHVPGEGKRTLEKEVTGFALNRDARLWCAPSDKATTYSPAYETFYESEMEVGRRSPTDLGWSFPLVFRSADAKHWGLITEAGTDENYCGTRLNCNGGNLYEIALPNPEEGNRQGSVTPTATLPWSMPWRVIILGDSPGAMVESTLVTDVSPAQKLKDTDWIRPGRVAWSWWSDNPSPQDGAKQMKFVDLAAEMGWEYVLVDANWTVMDNGTIHDVLRHAKAKGVGVLLWYNSGGPHNVVTEKPRDCFTYEPLQFIKQVPVVWDDTRFVAGYPGQYTVIARRNGNNWYLAGVNGEDKPREDQVKLGDWLGQTKYNLALIADGPDGKSFASSTTPYDAAQGFKVKLLPRGGFVAVLRPR